MPQPAVKQFSGIFVSYRRDDSSGHAGRLFDRLADHFGKERIFMDIDTIEPGEDFVQVIEDAVASCEILIIVIGRHWLTSPDETSRPMDNPNDFVRLEVAAALNRDIRVIPVLVQKANMPRPQDLPDDLAKLSRRNAVELSDLHWQRDVEQLVSVMERILASREEVRRAEQEAQARERRADEEKLRVEEERDRKAAERRKNETEEALMRTEEERVRAKVQLRTEQEAQRLVETEEAVPFLEDEKEFRVNGEHAKDEADEAEHQRTVEQALPTSHEEKDSVAARMFKFWDALRWQERVGIACLVVLAIVLIFLIGKKPKYEPQSFNQAATPTITPHLLPTAAENAARGDEFYKQQKYAEAEAFYREAVRLDPNNSPVRESLENALWFQKDWAKAELYYREVVRLYPNAKYNNMLGVTLFNQAKYPEAEPYLREAVDLDPNNAVMNCNLGDALYEQKKYPAAERYYRKAVQLDPNDQRNSEHLNRLLEAQRTQQ